VRKTYPVSAERGAADDIAKTSLKRLSRPGLRPLTAVIYKRTPQDEPERHEFWEVWAKTARKFPRLERNALGAVSNRAEIMPFARHAYAKNRKEARKEGESMSTMECLIRLNEILDAIFKKEMTIRKGIGELAEIGVSQSEARRLAYGSARLGRNRRAAAGERRSTNAGNPV
jgi:hypothetical protein